MSSVKPSPTLSPVRGGMIRSHAFFRGSGLPAAIGENRWLLVLVSNSVLATPIIRSNNRP
jgi:hypothetical protein